MNITSRLAEMRGTITEAETTAYRAVVNDLMVGPRDFEDLVNNFSMLILIARRLCDDLDRLRIIAGNN